MPDLSDPQARLLAAYTDIIVDLENGTASVDADEEQQEEIAQLFISAAGRLRFQLDREVQSKLTADVQALREGGGK